MTSQNPGMVGYFDYGLTYFQQMGLRSNYFVQLEYASIENRDSYNLRSLKLYDEYEFKRYETDREFTRRKGDRHGFGIAVSRQSIDEFELSSFKATYARHIQIGKTLSVASGLSASTSNVSLIESSDISELNIRLDAGFMLYGKTFFGGYSLKSFVFTPIKEENTLVVFENKAQHVFLLGFNHYLSHPFVATTFFSISKRKKEEAEFELGGTIEYLEMITLGAYVTQTSLVPQAGVRIMSKILISYSTRLSIRAEEAKHELHLGFVMD